jgi:hypothetical protein
MPDALARALFACQTYVPEPFRSDCVRLFHPEHLAKLAARLDEFHRHGVPHAFPTPHLSMETTPPLREAWVPFAAFMQSWQQSGEQASPDLLRLLAEALVAATIGHVLVLLGQRRTPGSLTDARAIPPPAEELLRATARPYHGRLSVGARALSKHLQRSRSGYWGELTGNDEAKNQRAHEVLQTMLRDATWWNVFEHYKHQVVFEARVAEGYGARWGRDGQAFIGFLEPFTPGFPRVRE